MLGQLRRQAFQTCMVFTKPASAQCPVGPSFYTLPLPVSRLCANQYYIHELGNVFDQ